MRVKSEDVTLSFMYRYMYIYALSFFMLENIFHLCKLGPKYIPYLSLYTCKKKCMCCISYLDFKSVVSHCCLKFYNKVYSGDWGLADALVYSIVPQRSSPLHMIPLVWHYTKHSRSTLIVLLVACFEILSEPKLFGHWISIRRCVSLCWCSLLIFFFLQWVFFFHSVLLQ